jgi:predicted aldo/keto reductase-like oxidoreductase
MEKHMPRSGHKSTRRDFLKTGMLGIAATAFAPAAFGAGAGNKPVKAVQRRIIRRTLGRTGLRLPIVSVGAGNVTDAAIIRAALDAGLTHFDTARSYGRGSNETMIASAIKDRPRDSFVIGTKSYNPAVDNRTGIYKSTTNAEIFGRDLDESLKALGLDYVDIFYVHDIVRGESIKMEPVLKAFEKAKQSGKARAIGVSTHRGEPEVIRAAIETKIWDVVLTAYNFRQPHLAEVTKAIAEATAAGLGIIAMKTQAGVFWDPERKQPINAKAALKWALQNENVHTAIPGVSTIEELEADFTVMEDLALSDAEKGDLRLGMAPTEPGLYCGQCGACVAQCRSRLDIPTLMRSYMYAYGYRKPARSRETLAAAGIRRVPCAKCPSCTVACTLGFPVRERAVDIARIASVPEEFLG